jgi:hypothetical protein
MLTSLHGLLLVLLEDGIAPTKAGLDAIGRRWTSRGLELQGWWLDIARLYLALASGDGLTAWRLSLPQARRYSERIFSTRVHRLEASTFLVRAGICIAKHGRLDRDALVRCRTGLADIASEPCAWARAHAHALQAGLESTTGHVDRAVGELRLARSAMDDAGMILQRTLADDALGTLLGGDEGRALVTSARERLRQWRVDRERAMATILPGGW